MSLIQQLSTNEELVDALKRQGTLRSESIIKAFEAIDRKNFVPDEYQQEAYGDYPLEIGDGQTISQPTTVAIMLELLKPKPGQKVLDVGSGSGWLTALLAHAVGSDGVVHGTEVRRDLAMLGRSNLEMTGLGNAQIHYTPTSLGWRSGAPYDRIIVSAATSDVPKELLDQLKSPGVMVIPIENSLVKISKEPSGRLSKQEHYGFAFVPLIRTA